MNASTGLTVRRHAGLEAVNTLSEDWERLLERSGGDPLCNGPRWTLSHARAFALPQDCFALTVHEGDELVAFTALKREPRRGRLALRRLQFLADGSFDSDYQDVVCLPDRESTVAAALLDALANERGADAVLLGMVRSDSPFLAALRRELDRRGLPLRASAEAAGTMDLPGDFEAYVGGLKKRMRSKLRQALRRAEEADLEWYTQGDDLEAWLDELWSLHTRRWNAAGRDGSFADQRRRAWYRDLVPIEAEAGTLALARLVRGGRTLAVQYGVLRGATYYQVQEGYDPELESERPGSQLRAAMLRELIARGVRRYDFMEGFTQHKSDWGAERIALVTLSFPLPRLLPRAVFAAKNALQRVRTAETSS